MKIILLSGKEDTGKSTTFDLLYNEITKNDKKKIVSEKKELGYPEGEEVKDFECIVKYRGKNVALYSMGDFDLKCIEAIVKYAHCDALVLAYSEKCHCIIKKTEVEPKKTKEQDKVNKEDCETILAELRKRTR